MMPRNRIRDCLVSTVGFVKELTTPPQCACPSLPPGNPINNIFFGAFFCANVQFMNSTIRAITEECLPLRDNPRLSEFADRQCGFQKPLFPSQQVFGADGPQEILCACGLIARLASSYYFSQ